MNINIGNKIIGPDQDVFIVAEISGNHNGDIKNALELINCAKRAGAHAIKLQTYTPDTITLKSSKPDFCLNPNSPWSEYKTLWDLFNSAHTPWEWHEEIFNLAQSLDLIYFSSPFDISSVDFLQDLGVAAYKVASPEINDIPLLEAIAKKGKPVILSTGMARRDDIDLALSVLRKNGANDIIILKCTSAYPTPIHEMNLSSISTMHKDYGLNIGLSDHSLGIVAPVVATSLGAVMIEKHIVIDDNMETIDSIFSSSEKEFSNMCQAILEAKKSIGKPTYELAPSVAKLYNGGRSLYIAEDIKKGEVLTPQNIRSVRPGFGLHTKHFKEIIGQYAKKDLFVGDRLTIDDYSK